jgi:hypothetical protein
MPLPLLQTLMPLWLMPPLQWLFQLRYQSLFDRL